MADRRTRVERALEALSALQVGDPGAREHVRTICAFATAPVADDTLWLLHRLDDLGVDESRIALEIDRLTNATGGDRRHAFGLLRDALEPRRSAVLRHLTTAPGDLRIVVNLRAALLSSLAQGENADLTPLGDDLRSFLATRVEVGSLELRRLTWRDSAALLERLANLEAVHAVRGWFDLKDRLDDDRRCYAFFHPALPDTPLVFIEVALTAETPSSIRAILNRDAAPGNAAIARSATFYSISNCEPGLSGIPFGNALIKRATDALRAELPQLRVFATLSPIPGFAQWVHALREKIDPSVRERLAVPGWHRDAATAGFLLEPLLRLAARYLLEVKRTDGAPLDPVARFHLGNGATVERLDWLADPTPRGLANSFGVMVNYRYAVERLANNQLAYARAFAVDAAPVVRALAAAETTPIGETRPQARRRRSIWTAIPDVGSWALRLLGRPSSNV